MSKRKTAGQSRDGSGEKTSAELQEKSRRKLVAIGFFLFFIILWALLYFFNRTLIAVKNIPAERPRFKIVEIRPGSSMSDIARKLYDEGLISNQFTFRIAATARRSTRKLKAGEFRFDSSMSALDILSWIEEGHVLLHGFTIPEGFTMKQIANRLDELGLANKTDFLNLANDRKFCAELGVEGPSLEGFLFPDTYKVAKGLPTRKLIRIMVDRFWRVYSREMRHQVVPGNLKLRDIIGIASIIEKEALFDDEEPLVASVIYNRLKKGIPLQCDVTIRYPLDNYGIHLTYADLRNDSPYNSYLYRGLPPTPICSPGLSAIRAAIRPLQTDYLYFVSMNNGRHKFSTSLREHNDAVLKYQIHNERG